MALFNKKPKEAIPMPDQVKVDEVKLTKETKKEEPQGVSIEEVALQLTEHQFKAYVISKLEEINERLK